MSVNTAQHQHFAALDREPPTAFEHCCQRVPPDDNYCRERPTRDIGYPGWGVFGSLCETHWDALLDAQIARL